MPHLAAHQTSPPRSVGDLFDPCKVALMVLSVLLLAPLAAHAQGSSFDTGFNAHPKPFHRHPLRRLRVWVAIVIGGYGFPDAKKSLAGVAAGTGITVMAVNVLSWI
jgi:hypothetical protein